MTELQRQLDEDLIRVVEMKNLLEDWMRPVVLLQQKTSMTLLQQQLDKELARELPGMIENLRLSEIYLLEMMAFLKKKAISKEPCIFTRSRASRRASSISKDSFFG